MSEHRAISKYLVWSSTPAAVLAAALGMYNVLAMAVLLLVIASLVSLDATRIALRQSQVSLCRIAFLVGLGGLTLFGGYLFQEGRALDSALGIISGAALALLGAQGTRRAAVAWLVPRPPVPPPIAQVVRRPQPPPQQVVVVKPPPPAPAPRPEPEPDPEPKNGELRFWAGKYYKSKQIDPLNFGCCAPPARGKTAFGRLFLIDIINEVYDPDCNSTLIAFDPKRQLHAWLASRIPPEHESLVPFRLFCPSDKSTWTLDWSYDFSTENDYETAALSIAPKLQNLSQPFFQNATRTVIEQAIGAIHRKMGYWDWHLLMNVLSNPGYLKRLVSQDKYSQWVDQLMSAKSEETSQNIQMEITTHLSKWRKIAAHLGHVPRERTFSLERFLEKPGILVIQKDEDYREQQNSMNAMLLQRIGKMLMKRPPNRDPNAQKIYIWIDEFPSLGFIEGLIDMMRELRDRNVVFYLIWQSWAHMREHWGDKADGIQAELQNWLILGSADPTDADHAAKLIGKERGFEPIRTEGTSSGTNWSAGKNSSETTQWHYSQTRPVGTISERKSFTGSNSEWNDRTKGPGAGSSDTRGWGGSNTTGDSSSIGGSTQDSNSVTWQYFDRDIKSATELLRQKLPARDNAFHGIGYAAGEPRPVDFVIEADVMAATGVFDKNRHIPDYQEWPERYQRLPRLTPAELERLGLEDADPCDPQAYLPVEDDEEPELPREGIQDQLPDADSDDGDWDQDQDQATPGNQDPRDPDEDHDLWLNNL